MSDDIEVIGIKTNISNLSERAVHRTLVDLVDHVASEGGDALKAIVPHDIGELAKHAGHKGPHDLGLEITASVGVLDIARPGSDPVSMKYPIFVDKGTGIYGESHTPIFAKRSHFMKLPPKEGYSTFQHEVKGQRPQYFMAKTFAFMLTSLDINGKRFKEELKVKLAADELK